MAARPCTLCLETGLEPENHAANTVPSTGVAHTSPHRTPPPALDTLPRWSTWKQPHTSRQFSPQDLIVFLLRTRRFSRVAPMPRTHPLNVTST